jgi:hypothetical protein
MKAGFSARVLRFSSNDSCILSSIKVLLHGIEVGPDGLLVKLCIPLAYEDFLILLDSVRILESSSG